MDKHFYSGFALQNEAHFFKPFRNSSPYSVSGFSYGAINAFEHVLASTKRIDVLQLFSPAFFQEKPEKYKRLQRMGYKKSALSYIEKFSENCFLPHQKAPLEQGDHTPEDLDRLLDYVWDIEKLQNLSARGTKIEVYLGAQDHINDVEAAYAFFKPLSTVTLIQGANHFLQTGEDNVSN